MKLQSTFSVKIESDADEVAAVFKFRKPKANKLYAKKPEKEQEIIDMFKDIMTDLVSVDGLEHENGDRVKVEEVKDLDLDVVTINAIVIAYSAGLKSLTAKLTSEADKEKKPSSPE